MAVVALRDVGTMLQAPACASSASMKLAMRAVPLAERTLFLRILLLGIFALSCAWCTVDTPGIEKAIVAHGVVRHPDLGAEIFAYEVNGYGAFYNIDDANVPSLLSLPYLVRCWLDLPLLRGFKLCLQY